MFFCFIRNEIHYQKIFRKVKKKKIQIQKFFLTKKKKKKMQPSLGSQSYLKVILLGQTGVGKTSLVKRWIEDTFTDNIGATIGSGNFFKTIEDDQGTINISLWDTAGQEQYRAIAPQYIRGAKCGIIVVSVADESSFQSIDAWVELFKENTREGTPIILAFSKVDLVPFDDVLHLSEPYKEKFPYIFFVSSKDGENVEALFSRAGVLAREVERSSRRKSELVEEPNYPKKKESCAC